MSEIRRWIDLRDGLEGSILKVGFENGEDGRRRTFLYVTNLKAGTPRWNNAIEKLNFRASSTGKYLVRQSIEPERIQASLFHSVWPNAVMSSMATDKFVVDLKPVKQLRETQVARTVEESQLAVETGVVTRLGRNADGDEVYSSSTGRYLVRSNGSKVYETDLLGPATFLHAPDLRAMNACADGFVLSMIQGEVQHSEDLDRFIGAITDVDGPHKISQYDEAFSAIDAAMIRRLSSSFDTAQDAYGDAERLYEYLPLYKGTPKGAAAMPLPLAVIAQRLLGDTKDKHILIPNAWDGASFAFLSQGTKIHAFRGSKDLSRSVSNVRADDVVWRDQFEPSREQGADGIIFNADPIIDFDGSRKDYRQAISALRVLNKDARAVLVLAGDDHLTPGVLTSESKRFFELLKNHYDVESITEMGSELSGRLGTRSSMRLIGVRNRPSCDSSVNPDHLKIVHSWDELKSVVDEVIATLKVREAESEGIDVDRLSLDNEFQRPYISFSKVGESRTMVPKNLQAPLQYALSKLEAVHGAIDPFVENELGFGPNTLGERFSPEQVDAIALGISRMKTGRGVIIGDETGIGKGRTISGYCTWAEKQGRNIIFVTDKANLFSDLVRDLRDIGEWPRFRPFIMNSDGMLVDVFTKEVLQKGLPSKVLNKIIDDGLTIEDLNCNIIFTTYSQISNEDSPKAEWILSQASESLVVVDEAHIAAGSNSNTSLVISDLVSRAWAVAYSSATWAKTSDNLHIYSRAFPETINMASLSATMKTGGEAFSEVFSSMLARDGALIRREHDLSKIEFTFEVDTSRAARNEGLSDKVAEILAAMTYVSGDINKLLMKINNDTFAVLKAARLARESATGAVDINGQVRAPVEGKILKSHFGAGSVLYQVMRRFLAVLNADHVSDLALKAISENRKPVIVFEDTGEVFVKRLIQQEIIPGIMGEKDTLPDSVRAPTIRDLLRNVMKRMGVISVSKVGEDYVLTAAEQRRSEGNAVTDEGDLDFADMDAITNAQDESLVSGSHFRVAELPGLSRQEQGEYEKGMSRIMELIDELPPMPLNAIDIVHARLANAGLNVGEISGRSIRLVPPDDLRGAPIDSDIWSTAALNIVTRARKKSDVADTVYGFNFGEYDAICINRSAATGISLHSSPRFGDVRRRELIEMQIPEDPTNRIQLYGRVNRYDQVCTPRISIATTGIYGEVRQLMQQNKKLARLSANIRSSSENAAEIKNIPDLLNKIGDEVCKRFLEDNGGIRSRVGISEKELDSNGFEPAKKLTSRVALLSVASQKMVYSEIYDGFHDSLARYEMSGENPLKSKEMDVRAVVKSQRIVVGVEMEGAGSAFDGPVYLKELEWSEKKRPFSWADALDLISEGRRKMITSGLAKVIESDRPKDEVRPSNYAIDGVLVDLNGLPSVSVASSVDVLVSEVLRGAAVSFGRKINLSFLDEYATPVDGGELNEDSTEVADLGTPNRYSSITSAARSGYKKEVLEGFKSTELAMPKINLTESIKRLSMIIQAKMRTELPGSGFIDVNQALASTENNSIKRANLRKLWIEKYLPRMVPGCGIGINPFQGKSEMQGDAFVDWGVVCEVRAPEKGKEAMLSRWKIDVVFPGDIHTKTYTLASLMEGVASTGRSEDDVVSKVLVDGNILCKPDQEDSALYRRRHLMDDFLRESSKSLTRKGAVLDGNMYMASEWAAAAGLGQGVIYTDERGARHRGVWLNSRLATNPEVIDRMPIRLWSKPMIEAFMMKVIYSEEEGGAAPNGPGGTFLFATNFKGALPSYEDQQNGTRVMIVPGKAVALVVDTADKARMLRMMRGHQKSALRAAHPLYKTYAPEMKQEVDKSFVKISSSEKKRGSKPIIFLDCVTREDFPKVVDVLCQAAGIELYLTRNTRIGDVAEIIQREYFESRRNLVSETHCSDVLDSSVNTEENTNIERSLIET